MVRHKKKLGKCSWIMYVTWIMSTLILVCGFRNTRLTNWFHLKVVQLLLISVIDDPKWFFPFRLLIGRRTTSDDGSSNKTSNIILTYFVMCTSSTGRPCWCSPKTISRTHPSASKWAQSHLNRNFLAFLCFLLVSWLDIGFINCVIRQVFLFFFINYYYLMYSLHY